jgi:hypothetical protein
MVETGADPTKSVGCGMTSGVTPVGLADAFGLTNGVAPVESAYGAEGLNLRSIVPREL